MAEEKAASVSMAQIERLTALIRDLILNKTVHIPEEASDTGAAELYELQKNGGLFGEVSVGGECVSVGALFGSFGGRAAAAAQFFGGEPQGASFPAELHRLSGVLRGEGGLHAAGVLLWRFFGGVQSDDGAVG